MTITNDMKNKKSVQSKEALTTVLLLALGSAVTKRKQPPAPKAKYYSGKILCEGRGACGLTYEVRDANVLAKWTACPVCGVRQNLEAPRDNDGRTLIN